MELMPGPVLLSASEIDDKVRKLAEELSRKYRGKEVVFITVLKGAVIFLSDLVRHVSDDVDLKLDFMAVSSYGDSTKTSGVVKINKDLDESINGRHLVIVEDIVDTGLTLAYLKKLLLERSPASVEVCALLDKKERREVEVDIDYSGFDIPDVFVVGYGLDFAGRWRNLRDIRTMVEENHG